MLKRFTILLFALLLLSGGQLWAADLVKVGFVDVQKVLEKCSEGKEARKKLDQMVKAREEVLKPDKELIDTLKKELDEDLLMREDFRRQKTAELQEKMRLFDDKRKRALDQVKIEEQKLSQPILEKVEKALRVLGLEDGYTIIFEKNYSSLLYASEQIDMTDALIHKLDEKYNQ